ncbi:hypothetical protein LOTGIDRAFT_214442 [Lottia gigantea]|uniref:GPR158/179 extracellular domain-containing protein n=1 Tax=Lottia gigantea TaxID=225164 RepID=V4AQ41_LOTGI|nr:hypothetical protein LOTGIDRAFT_214442 [Lottia gigantea]ESO96905.1 hypothetical protein LOTGIDRAFT_214442 [Lottia gigantea]
MDICPWLLRVFVLVILVSVQGGRYDWMGYDKFDEMEEIYNSVDDQNCRSKSKAEMVMREDLVTQIPFYNNLLNRVWYRNRTSLIHLHNMALNRAFFFSYILQKMNSTNDFSLQPNWLYMYFSVAADVNANPTGINASAIIFDFNCTYPNWYSNLPFNNTLHLFGPKAYRWDDYQDQDNFLREPTRNVAAVTDLGAGNGKNYTLASYKMNPWYSNWLPDLTAEKDSVTKFTYSVGVRYSNVSGQFTEDNYIAHPFFGPPLPGQNEKDIKMFPVTYTKPYFDCGVQGKWMFSATSPIIDYMPRYSNWTHMRRPRTVGVIVMDIDWDMIDFNSCDPGTGNPGPSYLSGIHRCKTGTTCKNKIGYGFMRGGYVCACKPGRRYPVWIDPPFQGEHIEQATDTEYKTGFSCSEVQLKIQVPPPPPKPEPKPKKQITASQRLKFHTRRKRSVTYDYAAFEKMLRILRQKDSVTPENCKDLPDNTLSFPGSVAYGVDTQFEVEARTALRLAHFLSNFLQNTDVDENYGNLRGGGRLHKDHLFGEVIANVMGNPKILSSGLFYDRNQFYNIDGTVKEYFGPLAFRKNGAYNAIDSAGLDKPYVDEDWFAVVKSRWLTNIAGLKTYKVRPHIRSNPEGDSRIRFEHFPLRYKAPEYKDGYWTNPRFKCDGRVDRWIVTYVIPFFGWDGVKRKIQFKGVVTVDVPLDLIEINQCPQPFHVANAFKNTARCDQDSTKCRPMAGFKFARGAYRCDCKEGFEYMHKDNKFWIEGSLIELEYEKKRMGLFSKFDDMRCRIAGGDRATSTVVLVITALISLTFI